MTDQAKTGVVQSFERITKDDGTELVEVTVDAGGGELLTLEHVAECGSDCPPLPGDFVALGESTGQGAVRSAGYEDTKNKGKALGGEKRFFARDAAGVVVAEFWMNVTEKVFDVQGVAPGWKYRLGKLEIDEDGNLTTPGEITAKAGTAEKVTLTLHIHPTGTGPSDKPTPGI